MYFAQLDSNNIVISVVVADQNFIDSQSGTWVQTDIDGVSPKGYAGIGYSYDSGMNVFIPPKPYSSWVLNNSTALWEPPTAYPSDGNSYVWDEGSTSWVSS